MKQYFKRITTSILVSSVITFILGLIMAAVPGISLYVMSIIIGIFFMLYGITLIILVFVSHNIYVPFYGIMSGILSLIAGLIIVEMPEALSVIFTIALGIWIILSSINTINIAITVKDKVDGWRLWLVFGILDIICGIIILINPFASSLSLVVLGGIILMVHSVITIIDTIMIRREVKNVTKAIEAKVKELK